MTATLPNGLISRLADRDELYVNDRDPRTVDPPELNADDTAGPLEVPPELVAVADKITVALDGVL